MEYNELLKVKQHFVEKIQQTEDQIKALSGAREAYRDAINRIDQSVKEMESEQLKQVQKESKMVSNE
jgi:pyruvate-formate lyase